MEFERNEAVGEWLEKHLGHDWTPWYDVGALVLAGLALVITFVVVRLMIRKINDLLETDGWRPVSWSMALWSAVTWLAATWTVNLAGSGEAVIALGLAAVVSFFWMVIYHIQHLRIVKGTGALVCNIATGLVITPLAQFGIILILCLIVLAIATFVLPNRVIIYR